VDVLVTRDGRPVANLAPADLEVLDNGVLQRIDYAAFEEIPLNLVFAIDASTSVAGEREAFGRRRLRDRAAGRRQAAVHSRPRGSERR
jgi:hypothetical protein